MTRSRMPPSRRRVRASRRAHGAGRSLHGQGPRRRQRRRPPRPSDRRPRRTRRVRRRLQGVQGLVRRLGKWDRTACSRSCRRRRRACSARFPWIPARAYAQSVQLVAARRPHVAGRRGDREDHRSAAEGQADHVGLLDPVRAPARRAVLSLVRAQPLPAGLRRALPVPRAGLEFRRRELTSGLLSS